MNDVLQTIANRISLRVYKDQPIDETDKNAIIQAAMRAPTAGNQMLYSMIVIKDQANKKRLSELCDHQAFIAKAPLAIVFVADHHKWFTYYQKNNVKQFCEDKDFQFEAPQESDLLLAIQDAMIAAQNSVIAAESLNIGSCYIGDIMENGEQVKELLKLPQYTMPIGMLVYGYYPDNYPKIPKKRFDKEFIVFEDQYRELNNSEVDTMFKDEEKNYNPQNPYQAKNFAQQFYARKTGAPFSKEMARSVRFWLKQWDGRLL